jgi:hypothetical protein
LVRIILLIFKNKEMVSLRSPSLLSVSLAT